MGEGLEAVHRDYIAALNDRRLDDLDRFVHDRLVYNGEEWTRERYRALLATTSGRCPVTMTSDQAEELAEAVIQAAGLSASWR